MSLTVRRALNKSGIINLVPSFAVISLGDLFFGLTSFYYSTFLKELEVGETFLKEVGENF